MSDANYSVGMSWSDEVNIQYAVGFLGRNQLGAAYTYDTNTVCVAFLFAGNSYAVVNKNIVNVQIFR